ncbi:hypothetical protein F66182_11746, partial [Fusarium sp. NRRL 66182]
MWSRINKTRDNARHYGGYATVESPKGQPVLQTTSGNPLPSKSMLKDLPALPSNDRVTSSIYSRDDSGVRFTDGNMPISPTRDYAEYSKYAEQQQEPEISPPDTPVDLPSAQAHSDVSPIDNDNQF